MAPKEEGQESVARRLEESGGHRMRLIKDTPGFYFELNAEMTLQPAPPDMVARHGYHLGPARRMIMRWDLNQTPEPLRDIIGDFISELSKYFEENDDMRWRDGHEPEFISCEGFPPDDSTHSWDTKNGPESCSWCGVPRDGFQTGGIVKSLP